MRRTALLLLLISTLNSARGQRQQTPSVAFQQNFKQAYACYESGKLTDAAALLEKLVGEAPESFDVRELLGLTYARQSREANAVEQLQAAQKLMPSSASARNNLAISLVRNRQPAEAEVQWRAALATAPGDFSANRNLARLYLQQGKLEKALPLLEAARVSQPGDLENAYDLALAAEMKGRLDEAYAGAQALLRQKDSAEAHALLGQIDEKQARYVDAVSEFSAAVHRDPSEDNLFIWASELMSHRAYEPAVEVFKEGTRRYPSSSRLWVGQGMALYARGDYEPAVHALLEAIDQNAADPRAYLFLSKAYLSSPSQAEDVIRRFRVYATSKPNDAEAQYFYAVSLWKGRRLNTEAIDYPAVEALLRRSIALNGSNAEVHLQLGILLNDERQYPPAQTEFERAVALDPELADAHFRLGRAYLRAGDKEKSQAELDRFRLLQAEHQAATDKERAEVQQFVVATQTARSSQPDAGVVARP